MGFLGGSLVCHDGVGSGIAGMDRLENVTKNHFTARTRFRLHSITLDSHSTESRAWPRLVSWGGAGCDMVAEHCRTLDFRPGVPGDQ